MRSIDADALLAEYDRIHVGPPGKARKLIEDAQTIEPQPHWIPCSERLPEDDVQVLCTDSEGFVYIAWHCDYDVIEKTKCWCDVHYCSLPEDAIIAWMPLPEPYREEQE